MHQHQWDEIAEEVNFNLEVDLDVFRRKVSINSKVLDFGCGYGRVSKILLDSGYRNTVGIDSSAKMIERGKREFPNIRLEMLEGEVLPYSDSSFDAIVACAVFTCITSQATRDNQFGELCRVLKTEGLLHMVEFCSEPSKSFTASIGIPMVYSTPLELRNLAHALQLVSEKVFNTSTMGGHQVYGYSLFAKKTLNKNSQQDAAKDVAPLL